MGSRNFCRRLSKLLPLLPLSLAFASLPAPAADVLSVVPPAKLTAKRGDVGELRLQVKLQSGYHANSNTPSESYLIPFRLTWDPASFASAAVTYPEAHMEKYEFSTVPLSVFKGSFDLVTKYKIAPGAPTGPGIITGKLRYQACNHNSCLPPKTVSVQLPVVIQ